MGKKILFMNIKYIISLSALAALAGASCRGASLSDPEITDSVGHAAAYGANAFEQQINALTNAIMRGDKEKATLLTPAVIAASEHAGENALSTVPNEIITQIAEFLPPASLVRLAQVNRKFNHIVNHMPWYQLVKKHTGNVQAAFFEATSTELDPKKQIRTLLPETISYLVTLGADINAINPNFLNMTALATAVIIGDKKMTEELLKNGANVELSGSYSNQTPLMLAINVAGPNKEKIVDLLIRFGANVNAKDGIDTTPLKLAIRNSNQANIKPIVAKLLTNGADISDLSENDTVKLIEWFGQDQLDEWTLPIAQ